MSEENHPTLTITDLTEEDAKTYCCRETADKSEYCQQSKFQLCVTGTLTVSN